MDIRALTPTYAVSPQIDPSDLPAIKAAGYGTVINNRPDGEIPADLHSATMQAAAEALGLVFIDNQIIGGMMTMDNVTAQAEAIKAAGGPVLAYCATGNRCSMVWALAQERTWVPAHEDELVAQAVADAVAAEPAVVGHQVGAGPRGQLQITLALRPGLTQTQLQTLLGAVGERIAADPDTRTRIDAVVFRLTAVP